MLETHSTILLVEDDPSILKLMETILKSENLETVKATTGAQAVRELRSIRQRFSLIITDYKLPDATGENVAQIARSQDHTKNIPILLISAEQSNGYFTKLMSDGKIDAYLAKPFAHAAFLKTVNLLLRLTKVQAG